MSLFYPAKALTLHGLCVTRLVLLSISCVGISLAQSHQSVRIYVREGCPRCASAEAYLEELHTDRPDLHIDVRPIDRDPNALAELRRLSTAANVRAPGVPTFVVSGRVIVGFDSPETTGKAIEDLLDHSSSPPAFESAPTCQPEADAPCAPLAPHSVATRFGNLSAARLGLPLFTIALGFLDGFNPCAMWVLMFLLSMLLHLRDRRRMALVGSTFVLVSGLAYFAFMAAWLNVFLLVGFSRTIQLVLGAFAIVIGALNVKDFVAFERGPSLSIPSSAKPGIYARVRHILRAHTLAASVGGVVVLAVLVNFFELLCTAGLPAVYTAILSQQSLPRWGHYAYLALYNLAYVVVYVVVASVFIVTLSSRKMTEKTGRWLKLVSGTIMLALAFVLLFAPRTLA